MGYCIMCDALRAKCEALQAQCDASITVINALSGVSQRKIKEVLPSPDEGIVLVMCEDGTLWYRGYSWDPSREWIGLAPVPGGAIVRSKVPVPTYAPESSRSDFSDCDETRIHDVQAYQTEEDDYTGEGEK